MTMHLTSIGVIKTPYKDLSECPRNVRPNGPVCHLHLHSEYMDGLAGLKSGDAILILYWLDRADRTPVTQIGWDDKPTGTFSLRSPYRPNPIAAAVVTIDGMANGIVAVRGLDCLSGTVLLDIKPVIGKEASSVRS